MIDGKNVFDQTINSMNKTFENIRKNGTGQEDDNWLFVRLFLFQRPLQNNCNRFK